MFPSARMTACLTSSAKLLASLAKSHTAKKSLVCVCNKWNAVYYCQYSLARIEHIMSPYLVPCFFQDPFWCLTICFVDARNAAEKELRDILTLEGQLRKAEQESIIAQLERDVMAGFKGQEVKILDKCLVDLKNLSTL